MGQRVVLGVSVLATLMLGLGSVSLWYTAQKLGDVERVNVAEDLTPVSEEPVFSADALEIITPEAVAEEVAATTTQPSVPPGPAENFLIVGSDNAEELDPDDPQLVGREDEIGNNLADTIMVLRLIPDTGQAYLLSVPRDLEVTVAGSGSVQKINAAFNYDEPYADRVARLINTVEENLDIGIQHYIEVDLAAFQRVVDAIGGVEVCFEGPTTDPRTGLNILSGGWHLLDGQVALQYVRSRSGLVAQQLDGTWVSLSPRADLDRIERQQGFVREAVDQTISDVTSSPSLLLSILDIAADELVVSDTVNVVSDGRQLASWFRNISDEDLTTESLSVVDLPQTATRTDFRVGMSAQAEGQLDVLRGIAPDAVVPKRVDLSVLGDGRVGVAGQLAETGFGAVPRPTGPEYGGELVIRYGVGGSNAANLVAAFLDASPTYVADRSLSGNQIVLELGLDTPTVLAEPRPLTEVADVVTAESTPTTDASVEGSGTTTTTEQIWAFDCSIPRGEDG